MFGFNRVSAREIAVSGLKAQRTRMNVIANNIANAQTTRTEDGGGAFRRQLTVLRGNPFRPIAGPHPKGVRVSQVKSDLSPLRQVFDPSHPDANAEGYVEYPNIDMAVEMVNLISAQRGYEANLAVMTSGKRMSERALAIIEV
jgi:flagellar basal-body rod protein FlgC